MILSTDTAPYFTEEENQRIKELRAEQGELLYNHPPYIPGDELSGFDVEAWAKLEDEINNIELAVENRYIKSKTKKEHLADVKGIIEAVEQKDFLDYIRARRETLEIFKERGGDTEELNRAGLKDFATANYNNCLTFLLITIRIQLNAFAKDEEYTQKAKDIVNKRVSVWYKKPEWEQDTWKMVHNRATDELNFIGAGNVVIDPITKKITVERPGFALTLEKDIPIEQLDKLTIKLGTGATKLLDTALATFTKNNDFRSKRELERNIVIPLKDYAKALGKYDLEEHKTSTPEEAEAEKKRVKIETDNARRAIKKHIDTLYNASLAWNEKETQRKPTDFEKVRILTRAGIKKGYIRLALSPELAGALAEKKTITEFPPALLGYDERNNNAFYIGKKIAEQYANDNNYIKGTTNRLRVKTLLAVTSLPSYEEVQEKDRGHWVERIKTPFENALDYNVGRVLIAENYKKGKEPWKYTKEKGIELTEEERERMLTDYTFWSSLYITYEVSYTLDREERIEERIKEKKAKEANKKRRKKKS